MMHSTPSTQRQLPSARAANSTAEGSTPPESRRVTIPYMEKEKFQTTQRTIIKSAKAHEIVPGVWVTGEIPRLNDFEDVGGPFYLDSELTKPDLLLDHQSIFIPTDQGLIVIFDCAHAGVINTLQHIKQSERREREDLLFDGWASSASSIRTTDDRNICRATPPRSTANNFLPLHRPEGSVPTRPGIPWCL